MNTNYEEPEIVNPVSTQKKTSATLLRPIKKIVIAGIVGAIVLLTVLILIGVVVFTLVFAIFPETVGYVLLAIVLVFVLVLLLQLIFFIARLWLGYRGVKGHIKEFSKIRQQFEEARRK